MLNYARVQLETELMNKKAWVESYLSPALVNIPFAHIERVEYKVLRKDNSYQEFLVVRFRGGGYCVRNCEANSISAIFREAGRLIDGGYYTEVEYFESITNDSSWKEVE